MRLYLTSMHLPFSQRRKIQDYHLEVFQALDKENQICQIRHKKGDLSRDSGLILAWLWGGLKMGGEGGLFAFASFPPFLFSQKYVLSPKKYILIQISVVMLLRLL